MRAALFSAYATSTLMYCAALWRTVTGKPPGYVGLVANLLFIGALVADLTFS